jgi:hypothetical protein
MEVIKKYKIGFQYDGQTQGLDNLVGMACHVYVSIADFPPQSKAVLRLV